MIENKSELINAVYELKNRNYAGSKICQMQATRYWKTFFSSLLLYEEITSTISILIHYKD